MANSVMDAMYRTTSCSGMNRGGGNEDGETEAERATHNTNYHLLIIFHADQDNRPCRPVLQVVHLSCRPEITSAAVFENPRGTDILTTCQLCDPSTNTTHAFQVDLHKLLCICTVSITDTEAGIMINNVSRINTHTSQNDVWLSERSNFATVPLWLHRFLKIGKLSMDKIDSMSSATDVQLAIILVRESIDKARSLWLRVDKLHPVLSTPENVYDAISTFTRKLDTNSFRSGAFKFITC